MLYIKDNDFLESGSPHSVGLKNNITIPSPGFDSNPLLINEKKFVGSGGMQGLTFDGTGLFGSGLFSGDPTTWGVPEVLAGAIGVYAIYAMVHQGKQTKYRMEGAARRRRVSKAARLRAQAKKLEDQEGGWF